MASKATGPILLLSTSRKARWWTVGAAVVAFLIGGCVYVQWWSRQFFHAVFVGDTGPVALRADWPRPLQELLNDADGIQIDASTIQVHCLCQGFDPTFVWRMDAAPGLFEHIKERWELTQVSDPKWYVLEGYKSHASGLPAPEWWSPKDDGSTTFYVSPQVLAGGRSDHLHVALDEKRNTIWVFHWFNF